MPARRAERGFTLAAMIVILTILAIVVAYTVPDAWSDIMKREREKQTIWAMKQYARGIVEFQKRRGALPTKIDDLKEQKNPRVMRALYPDPLTGKMDWILISPAEMATQVPGVPPPPVQNPPQKPKQGEYVGPFVGVRPPLTGKSMLMLKGMSTYEQWSWTTQDYMIESGQIQVPNQQPPVQQKP